MKRVRYLTTGQIAKRHQVSPVTVQRWIKSGMLKAGRTPGGHFRVREDEFQRFLTSHGFPDEPRRILVVDDSPSVVEAFCALFRELIPACKVEGAFSGYEGLLKVGVFRPHLLVLDLRMPGLDGFEVCRRIKADPEIRTTKILAVTAYPEENTREEALRCGADAFLAKPFRNKDLVALAERLTG